ncbi:MAG: helix-turn-helix transcriptional regulator, partial [Corynebacterium variabile]
FRDAEQWAELELTEEAMWMLEYLPVWHIDGTRVEIPDTGAWLERFILAYAPEITAVVPDTLAGRVGQRSSAALAAYRRLA